jgi:hypothetical protein
MEEWKILGVQVPLGSPKDCFMKRNDIVMEVECKGFWSPFGRIVRRISTAEVEVIWCTKQIEVVKESDLILKNDYKGFWIPINGVQRWIPMSTLRKLKQMASRYNPNVWKKNRK